MKKLLRLSLQFFGEAVEEDFEDFESDIDVEDDFDNYEDDDPTYDDDEPTYDDDGPADDDNSAASDEGEGAAQESVEEQEESNTGENDLLDELRMLGYVGKNLAEITADVKAKREASREKDASAERRAVNAEGKGHIKSGKPGKSATGDGTGGVSERRVIDFAERVGCTRAEARQKLAHHAKKWN